MDKIKFEVVMNKYSQRIFNYLLKTVRDREVAEDLLQEVFVAFYKKMDTVKEASYLAYLYRTAYHKALNHISSHKRKRSFIELLKKESHVNDIPETDDRSSVIRKAFQKLKPQEALILELQYYQKLSYKEIAAVLETSVAAVDSKLVRAKRKLKKILLQDIKRNEVLNYRGDSYEQKIRL